MTTMTTDQTAQRRHESPELGAMVRRMVRSLVRRASEGDTEALEALAQLERELPTATSSAMAMMQAGTRRPGLEPYSYTELGSVVGTTRQAARQRAISVLPDDVVADYYTDGASTRLDWSLS